MNSFFQEHQLHNGIVWRISGFQDKTSPWNAKSGKRFGSGSRRGEPQYDNLPYSPHVSEKTSDAYALSIWTKW